MATPSSTAVEKLLTAENYREFLKVFIDETPLGGKRINLAELARRAQFSSRSFVSDVIRGQRRITPNSLPRFTSALKLKSLWAQYFELMVMRDETDCRPLKTNRDVIESRLGQVRKKISDRLTSELVDPSQISALFTSLQVFDVFAGLGGEENGASMDEIKKRTGLELAVIATVVESLTVLGFVEKKDERYFANINNFDLGQLGDNHGFLQLFQQALKALYSRSKNMKNEAESWYFHTALTVQREQVPELNRRLKEVVFEFLNKAQFDEGDAVLRLTLGCYC